MKILAFDSTAKTASVAILDDERILGTYNIENGLTQSELLLPMIESLLKSLNMSYGELELFACSAGPGSFTGVRIGAALLKGIAFGRKLPVVAVSTLEALAENLNGLSGTLVPVMDARRSQFYTATFSSCGGSMERLTPDRAVSASSLAEELRRYEDGGIYLAGDGYETAKRLLDELGLRTLETPPLLISQNAYSVGRIALQKYKNGEYTTDAELLPTYLRLPQAERERLEREAAQKAAE